MLIGPERYQLKDGLFLFAFYEPLAEFTIMHWAINFHAYKSLDHLPRFRWDCGMLQYTVVACLIQFAFLQVQIPDFLIDKLPYTIIERAPCFTVDVMQESAALSLTLLRT